MSTDSSLPVLKASDFASDQEIRWCPGCGDYSILAQVKKVLPSIGVPLENTVFVSGIGCSSRFLLIWLSGSRRCIAIERPIVGTATGRRDGRPPLPDYCFVF